jgi:tetratricopeptide (TPR) repeat protein
MRLALLAPLLLAVLLAGCDSAAERAETHYQRALAYLEDGDEERATVAFRNVFRLNPEHAEARLRYAELLRAEGATGDALGQYQKLAEIRPDMAEAHTALAELALEVQDFDTATVHATRAFELDPDDPRIRALKATVDFRRGLDRPAAVRMAAGVLADEPGNVMAHLVLVADRLRAKDTAGALARVEDGLATVPSDEGLHLARLALLEEKGDTAAVGDELATMNRLFPANEGVQTALVQWHLRNGDADEAERVLRAAAGPAQSARESAGKSAGGNAGADPGPALALAQFLLEVKGPDAARAELAARAAAAGEGAGRAPYVRAAAGLDFAEGRHDAAIAALRDLLAGLPPGDESRNLEIVLAGMLAATGKQEESAALVEKVLAEDHTHVAALKLRARAAIAADRPDAAVQDMRTALTAAPRDPEVMTIMAFAHERAGDRGLMGERLALAVELSNRAPEESLRYANFLMQEDRPGPAEGIVVDALRRDPENRELLATLGRIHLARKDWTRAGQIADLLRAQGGPVAAAMAARLDAARLQGEGKPADAAAMLEMLASGGPGAGMGDGGDALAAAVRARLAAGEPGEARRTLEAALADDPGSVPARFLLAGLDAIEGRDADAEARLRALAAEEPALPEPHLALFRLLAGRGDIAGADAALEAGIAAAGDANGELLFLRAGLRESRGDIAGAVADYETLYARSSDSAVVANNLASLLTTQAVAGETDAATLERAFAIARRLRGTEVPEFQDTYGWLLFLRGSTAEARDTLARAAAALPGNAQVQFHLGEAERALANRDAARAAYAAALAAAEAGSPLPQAAIARARLAEPAAPAEGAGAGGPSGG